MQRLLILALLQAALLTESNCFMQVLAGASPDPQTLGQHLHGAGLGALATALSLPEPALPGPRDPHGFFSGLLDHNEDTGYWPIMEFDPSTLDLETAEASSVLGICDWPLLEATLKLADSVQDGPVTTFEAPLEPSTPDGLGDHRGTSLSDQPALGSDHLDVEAELDAFGDIRPDSPAQDGRPAYDIPNGHHDASNIPIAGEDASDVSSLAAEGKSYSHTDAEANGETTVELDEEAAEASDAKAPANASKKAKAKKKKKVRTRLCGRLFIFGV